MDRLVVKRLQRNLRDLHHLMTNLKQIIRANLETCATAAMKLNGRLKPARLRHVSSATCTADDCDGFLTLGHETSSFQRSQRAKRATRIPPALAALVPFRFRGPTGRLAGMSSRKRNSAVPPSRRGLNLPWLQNERKAHWLQRARRDGDLP